MTWCNKSAVHSNPRILTLQNPLLSFQNKIDSLTTKTASSAQKIFHNLNIFLSSFKSQVAYTYHNLSPLSVEDEILLEEIEKKFLKMCKNSIKAVDEHCYDAYKKGNHKCLDSFATIEEINRVIKKGASSPSNLSAQPKIDLKLTQNATKIVPFCHEFEKGFVVGMFQCREDITLAHISVNLFQKLFPKKLQQLCGNVYETFKWVYQQIHLFLTSDSERDLKGCTCLVSYVDLSLGLIYTATLGDGEANLYRNFKKSIKSVPLSCLRNWSTAKDVQRAQAAYNRPELSLEWLSHPYPHSLQCMSLNISRGLGYYYANTKNHLPLIIQKAKITVQRVFPGDILTLVNSDVKESLAEHKIVKLVSKNPKSLSKAILKKAWHGYQGEMAVISLEF